MGNDDGSRGREVAYCQRASLHGKTPEKVRTVIAEINVRFDDRWLVRRLRYTSPMEYEDQPQHCSLISTTLIGAHTILSPITGTMQKRPEGIVVFRQRQDNSSDFK